MKIFCIGKNYLDHIKELDHDANIPTSPVIFIKPDTALVEEDNWKFPSFTKNLQHEVELVFKVSKKGKNIHLQNTLNFVNEMTIGLDLTARDIQAKLKQQGLPWEVCKSFDGSAVVGKWESIGEYSNLKNINFSLQKNGLMIQQGNSKDMLYSLQQCIREISIYFTLEIGDLIFTGTPPGFSSLVTGDMLEGFLEQEKILSFIVK
ncbi:MAG: fumarylacetoacetate hydrolase family protein [Chitinophagaceae bacterium]